MAKDCWDSVIIRMFHKDPLVPKMRERQQKGCAKYGEPLYPYDGQDGLERALNNALDAVVWLEQSGLEGQVDIFGLQDDALKLASWIQLAIERRNRIKERTR